MTCQYNKGWDGLCGAEAKFWYGPMWLCWEHYESYMKHTRIAR